MTEPKFDKGDLVAYKKDGIEKKSRIVSANLKMNTKNGTFIEYILEDGTICFEGELRDAMFGEVS